VEYEKKFLIIGNMNAITYRDIFPLVKENKIWVGYNNGTKEYMVPNNYKFTREENGIKYQSMGNTYWFTNIETKKRHEDLLLYKKYNDLEYPKYDNYDAINVDKTKDIPIDYDDEMGVPITFIDKYNPDQFEIVAHHGYLSINGKTLYRRILIKKRVK
jgi:hypothetical protein